MLSHRRGEAESKGGALKGVHAGSMVPLCLSFLNTIAVTQWGVLYLLVTEHLSCSFMLFDWPAKAASEKDDHPFAFPLFFGPDS